MGVSLFLAMAFLTRVRCAMPSLSRSVKSQALTYEGSQVPAFAGKQRLPTRTDGGHVRPPDAGLQVLNPPSYESVNATAVDQVARHEGLNATSGIPANQLERTVFIYSPAKSAMQSGIEKNHKWLLEVENPERWRNPLMGWASTADPLSNMKLYFSSQSNAIAYCERQGWNYQVSKNVTPVLGSNDRGIIKSYADVFKYKGTKRRPRK